MIKAALDENNTLKKVTLDAERMIGQVIMFGSETPPEHTLACDGSAISRTTYAALFAAIGTTWGAGDGSSTFNVPDLRGEWVQGAGTNAVGADIAEGLPNITGYITEELDQALCGGASGAFQIAQTYVTYAPRGDTRTSPIEMSFDASRSSAIYGASQHVTPKSKALKACIIYE